MKKCKGALVAGLCLIAMPLSAVAQSAPSTSPTTSKSSSPASVRAEVHQLLKGKVNPPVVVAPFPAFPKQTPYAWLKAGRPSADAPTSARFSFVAQALMLFEQLLKEKDEARRRQGFVLASESANYIATQLPQEHWLLARVYEGFLLPHLSLANLQNWRDPSRQRILEAAVSAFEATGEADQQKRVLEWLLEVGTQKGTSSIELDINTLDWVRGTLAVQLMQPENASRTDLERALQLFQSIQSPEMTGFKHLQTQLEIRLQQLSATS